MKRKIWLIIIAIIVVIASILYVITPRSKIPEGVLDVRVLNAEWTSFEGSDLSVLSYKIDTKEELDQFKFDVGNKITSINRMLAKYDSAFFEENSLVLFHFKQNGIGYNYEVDRISCRGSTFRVKVKKINGSNAMLSASIGWLVIIEAENELVSGCTKFKLT